MLNLLLRTQSLGVFSVAYKLLVVLLLTQSSQSLSSIKLRSGFNFPDDPPPEQPDPNAGTFDFNGLERQVTNVFPTLGIPGTPLPGIIPGTIPGTIPGIIPGAPLVPSIVTTPVAAGQTCICVPTGTCNTTGTTGPGSVDGTGLIDLRIVTNPSTAIITPGTTQSSCAAGLVLCCQAGTYQCGVRYPPVPTAPAAGAGQAPYGAYPWQAALLGPGDVYVASGVLINALNVLTVAHRITNFVTAPATLKVRLGEWNAAAATEPLPAQDFTVTRITTHPNFNAANLKNNVAVLRLSAAVALGAIPTIGTACLPVNTFAGSRCWVSGWGRNDFVSGTFQAIQKQVDVPILQNAQCQSSLSATRLGTRFVFDTTSFICAGGENGKDACTGDGGSPLVCSLGGRWFVAGLVAWGIGCGTSNVPGVYVNVQSYVPWIQTAAN